MQKDKQEEKPIKKFQDFEGFDFSPCNNRITVYVPAPIGRTKGGVILPDSAIKGAIKDYFDSNKFHLVVAGAYSGSYVSIEILEIVLKDMFTTPKFSNDLFLNVYESNITGVLDAASVEDYLKGLKTF